MIALSAKTCNYRRVGNTLPKQSWSTINPEKVGNPQKILIFPNGVYRYSSASIPGSLDIPRQSIRMFPGRIQDTPSGAISQRSLKSFPAKVESSYPVDSGILSPAEYKCISPAKSRGYPHKSLTGLSSASCNGKIIPSGVHHQNPQ